jgi:methylated-DNA-[protein]-cysteine S-methyltransferase
VKDRPTIPAVVRHRYAVDGWGVGEVIVADGVLVAHELPDPSLSLEDCPRPAPSRLVKRLTGRVRAHLSGERSAYDDIPLELSWCTEFQRELAAAIRDVPWGEIVSYGELAALAGRPGAARAAGAFCARNRFALVFPCHRVVSSTGVGGYGSAGIGLKRRLLALEGIEL